MSGRTTPEDTDGVVPVYEGETQALIDAVRVTNEPSTLNPNAPQFIVIPAGSIGYEPDLSAWRDSPTRRTGTYRPATVEAFTAITTLYANDATTVWVHPTSGKIVAVFDDNTSDDPGWGQFRAEFQLATTPEWRYWASNDKKMLGQEEFAEHIEGGLEEIVTPDAADLLEIAQSFHATKGSTFRSQTRLSSGATQFQYDEELQATAGSKGELTVPTVILLAVAPFIGEDRWRITARLRFRLNGGKLTIGYFLDRPESVLQDALEGVAERLSESFPLVFVGESA